MVSQYHPRHPKPYQNQDYASENFQKCCNRSRKGEYDNYKHKTEDHSWRDWKAKGRKSTPNRGSETLPKKKKKYWIPIVFITVLYVAWCSYNHDQKH